MFLSANRYPLRRNMRWPSAMTPALAAAEVTVSIGAKTLLDGVSLSLAAGETAALVGPNGAGKSTLLRVLSGDLVPRTGVVSLKGRAVASYGPRALAGHRAVLSQSIGVTFPFTVAEIVRMGAGDRRGQQVDDLVDAALAEVDLSDFHERVITTLSGGEQQRAHLARVLVQLACGEAANGPGLLLLDEPTAALDLRHQLDVIAATRARAAHGTTVIAILHDLNLAVLLARRIVVLDHGRIDADGPPDATITDAVLERVFGVAQAVGSVPASGMPFILPHAARKAVEN
jgi:iron complex transport system ATP-binding protein